MKIEPGMSGYLPYKKFPLDDFELFKKKCFTIAEWKGYKVEFVKTAKEHTYCGNYDYAKLVSKGHDQREIGIVHNIHFPLVAFIEPLEVSSEDLVFIDADEELYDALSQCSDYNILSTEYLSSPITEETFTELKKQEIKAILYWKPKINGEVLFNWWD